MVTIRTTSLTLNNSTFCPHSVFLCFVWIWEPTVIISLYSFNWLVFITEMECVYCAVRTGSLYVIHFILSFWTASLQLYFNTKFCSRSSIKEEARLLAIRTSAAFLVLYVMVSNTKHLCAVWGLQQVPRQAIKVLILTEGSPTVASPHVDSKNPCESLGGHGINSNVLLGCDTMQSGNRCQHCEQNWYLPLRSKPAGRGFDSRWCHWNFSVT